MEAAVKTATAEAEKKTAKSADTGREEELTYDIKMITFSLAGKDYSIDIMKIKEIAKASSFTYVPNTAPYVLGVYNLRGDIIPVIDLRVFFNIPVSEDEPDLENMLIVSVADQTFGIVVDVIDKVINVDSSKVRPPHPLFGDINIKYISAVVENNGVLYILLDIERIFGRSTESAETEKDARLSLVRNHTARAQTISQQQAAPKSQEAAVKQVPKQETADVNYQFVVDNLLSLKKFAVSDISEGWMRHRYDEWKKERGANVQLKSESDADSFLAPFFSRCNAAFWTKAYADAVYGALPDNSARQIYAWNPGCGRGYEAYSLACLFKKRYPAAKVKIFAQDIDLISVSNASLLTVPQKVADDWYAPYIIKTASGGYTFNADIKEMVLFEYHDFMNTTALSVVDMIFCRDVISFLPQQPQKTLLSDFAEKLKGNGIVIVGDNETIGNREPWRETTIGSITVYSK
jgi:purine-binding chemotaxis protein CheW